MAREAPRIRLYLGERELLQQLVNARSTAQGKASRARLILRCADADAPTNLQVAAEYGCDPDTVSRWRRRFLQQRLPGLHDLPRSGRPATFSPSRPPSRPHPGHHQAFRSGRTGVPLVVGGSGFSDPPRCPLP